MENNSDANGSSPKASQELSRKRRRISEDLCSYEEQPATKILLEEPPFNLQQFSDEILFEIFINLDGNDLYSLQQSCYRFYQLIQDYRFWRNIDLTSKRLTLQEIKSRLKWMTSQTKEISVRGLTETFPSDKWKNITVSETLLKSISAKCENLQVLEMHSAYLNFDSIHLTDFPRNLRRLVFNNCNVVWPKATPTFFTGMDEHFKILEDLRIEHCNWFEPYDLMVFSKLQNLTRLSIKGCNNLNDFVPYGSMSTRFGFKKLQHLDIRHTPITDSDLQCFNCVYSMREILLECPEDLQDKPSNKAQVPMTNQPSSSNSSGSSLSASSSASDAASPRDPNDRNGREERVVDRHLVLNPDRVLYINLEERRQQLQREGEAGNIPEQQPVAQLAAVNHPLFWDMLNYRLIDRALSFERERPLNFSPPRIGPISDRGICSFGRARNPVAHGLVCIRLANRPPDNFFERMTIRHYKQVTDLSLLHLVQCSPHLVFIDLTGTSVTAAGVEQFKLEKPNCHVVSDHFTG